MRYLALISIGFLLGLFVAENCKWEADASLEFRQDDIVLHVGADSIILNDEVAAAIALDINEHLNKKGHHE